MPEETLLVRRAAFGELVTAGKPVGFNLVAAATSLTPDTTRRALRLVESAGMAETNEDRVVGIDGLTTRATRHEIELNGVSLWTWCAYDIVGIAAALGADAAGETACGWCNRPIEVAVRKGRPAGGTTVGWLPKESCSNVMEQVLSLGPVLLLRGASGAMEGRDRSAVRRGARSHRARPAWGRGLARARL